MQKVLAQIGPTAFVAQDVTQRRGIGSDALAIIETRIGTSTQNTGNALGVLAQGTGGAKKVGPHVELRSKRGKDPGKDSTDDACAHGIAASTIEVDIERGNDGPSAGNLLSHSIKLLYDIILTLMDGIDAVIPVGKTGKKYVLCAWYRKSVWKILEEQLKTGDYKVQHVLENLRVCYMAVQGITDGPGKFYNINTPEEYRKIIPEKIKEKAQQTPVVSFVAYSGTGKTTFLEKLIPKLKAYGLKIAIVKHDGHRFDIDHEGKDSDRFTKAGADVTGLISSEKAVLMDNRTVDPEEFLKKIDGVDLILTEGFKHGPWPKIMLHRKENGKPMPLRPEECLAVISDVDVEDCENVFPLDDVGKTAVFLLQYIQQNMQHIENL